MPVSFCSPHYTALLTEKSIKSMKSTSCHNENSLMTANVPITVKRRMGHYVYALFSMVANVLQNVSSKGLAMRRLHLATCTNLIILILTNTFCPQALSIQNCKRLKRYQQIRNSQLRYPHQINHSIYLCNNFSKPHNYPLHTTFTILQ